MGDFREHGVLIYLDKDLYTAFIRLQADKGLGRSYAGLLPFTEGMYHLGYISKEAYETHVKKYSEQLVAKAPLSSEQLKQKRCLETKDRLFKQVFAQWAIHENVEWREKFLKQAEEWKDKLESARQLLKLREETHPEDAQHESSESLPDELSAYRETSTVKVRRRLVNRPGDGRLSS